MICAVEKIIICDIRLQKFKALHCCICQNYYLNGLFGS
uniref:Uncharacterized protein n=1 Tax=Anguilla anguilla TaxID=7936 RepID=A0A0E9SII1_ANGAN